MASTIGIKIANGEFYSIIEENSSVKKRLILTTVHDKQQSVQIDLYRSVTRTMADAQYIGSLVVEDIDPKPRGEPSIEMVIASDENGDITADAIDLDTSAGGEHHILNVSLKSLDETGRDEDIPDFELEQNEEPPSSLYQHAEVIREEEERKQFPWLILIGAGAFIIIVLLALWFFFLRGKGKTPVAADLPQTEQSVPAVQPGRSAEPVQPSEPAQPAQSQPPVKQQPAAPLPVIEAPKSAPPARPQTAARTRPPAPVLSYKVPATIPKGGVPYKIRWGDTLWDISQAFYRNPWLYPRIARFNNIRNPNLIISGTTIRIPPKN
jgi:LysM repeat protein